MISILCPTRGRVSQVKAMVQSARATAKDFEILFYLDEDDDIGAAAVREQLKVPGPRVDFKVGPRIVLTQCWNELIPMATGDIFMQGNDDIIFRTPRWDSLVESAFANCPDKILMVHGDDGGHHHGGAAVHPFVHRTWIDAIGYFIPPYFSSDYGDTWINDLANTLGRRKFLPFIVEHMHYTLGKAEVDRTTKERLERHQRDNPCAIYAQLEPERLKDIEKLRARITSKKKWSILILTQPSRAQYLQRMLSMLMPQVKGRDDIEVIAMTFDERKSLGTNRQDMMYLSSGQYVNFIDDDDVIATDYVASIYPRLDGEVDYIGFQLQCYVDDVPLAPTYHSLKHSDWYSDAKGHYRDISHLNPMKRTFALYAAYEGGHGEDHRWADQIRRCGVLRTESYVDKIMYSYYSRTQKQDAAFRFEGPQQDYNHLFRSLPKHFDSTYVAPHPPQAGHGGRGYVYLQNEIGKCPRCYNAAVSMSNGHRRCNQCGHLF